MKIYLIFCILLSFFFIVLTGCSSILTIGTASFITTTWYDSRTFGAQLDDNILKMHIYYHLNKNEKIKKFTRIINTVYQGNVLLTGQSPYSELTKQAFQITMNINGVKNIYNAIRQNQPIPLQNILLDFFISNQIRLSLLTQKNIHISNIKIISENKEIFLLGQVSYEEGNRIKKIVKNIKGVKNVFSIFTYI